MLSMRVPVFLVCFCREMKPSHVSLIFVNTEQLESFVNCFKIEKAQYDKIMSVQTYCCCCSQMEMSVATGQLA